jgi:hypothetical protein
VWRCIKRGVSIGRISAQERSPVNDSRSICFSGVVVRVGMDADTLAVYYRL